MSVMKKIVDTAFILASLFIIIMSAYEGATMHDKCGECIQGLREAQPYQFYVESGDMGLGYMLVNW
jgi:hypothetical protein